MENNLSFYHDIKQQLREDLAAAEKQYPGQKFTAQVEITGDLELKITLIPEPQGEPV